MNFSKEERERVRVGGFCMKIIVSIFTTQLTTVGQKRQNNKRNIVKKLALNKLLSH